MLDSLPVTPGIAHDVQEASRPAGGNTRKPGGLGRASLQNAIGQAVPLLVGLACVPFIVRALGPERFGIVALAWTVAGYFTLFDLGLGRAVTKLGAEAWIAREPGTLRQIVSAAQSIQLVFGALVSVALLLAAPLLANRLRIPDPLLREATQAFRVLAVAIPAILLTTTFRGALEAVQRFDLVNLLRAPLGASTYVFTLIGALSANTTTPIIWSIVGARVAGALGYAIAYQRAVPRASHAQPASTQLGRLLRFGGWVSATSALVPIIGYVDRFLIGALVSLAAVAYYTGPYELATRLLIVPGGIAAALLPTVSQRAWQGAETELRAALRRARLWCALAAGVPALLLFLLAEPVLQVWLGADYAAAASLSFRLLLLAAVANALALAPFATLEGLGRPDLVTKYHLIELPVYGTLALLAIREWGIAGAGLVWLVRNVWGVVVLQLLAQGALRARGAGPRADTRPAASAAQGSIPR
jgi:O-antigen/teichoic acid export membrane protein